ncbi:MAG: glycerol-3-phosphate acyltransferase [Bacillota bacterium]|jgi:glycerol-3-phosphate acyltransferase PlsY|nr:glycerol-3-phosphate acyltransferase [Bacillota bacterium]NLL26930.1 glycerol-3-phosphate acyltransferase [Erysipelotrichia bacterium]
MNYFTAILLGYGLGCINPAYILGIIKGFDIRNKGTFNAGASNAKVTMGWPAFFVVVVYDILKAFIAVFLIRYLYPGQEGIAILAGCMAVVGHIFPFYLQFKGGKGFASYIGLVFAIDWRIGIALLIIGLALSFIANWIVMATLVFVTFFPIYCILSSQPLITIIASIAVSLLIIYKHFPNFKKLKKGEEIGINGKPVTLLMKKEN